VRLSMCASAEPASELCVNGLVIPGQKIGLQERETQRNPALKEYEESFHDLRKLNWVVTPADGPCIGSVSLFFREKR